MMILKMSWRYLLFLALFQACASSSLHTTEHTWREQHLLSVAVQRAMKQLPRDIFLSGPISIRVNSTVADISPFIEAAIRNQLQEEGFLISEVHGFMPPTQILDLRISAASAETSASALKIPFPVAVPLGVSDLGIPLFEKKIAWAWVEYSGSLSSTKTHHVFAKIPPTGSQVYVKEYSYISFIGPFQDHNLPDDDPVVILDWE